MTTLTPASSLSDVISRVVPILTGKVTAAAIFGSFATDTFTESSDVDILIDSVHGKNLFSLIVELTRALGRPAHVTLLESIKKPYLQASISSTMVPIIGKPCFRKNMGSGPSVLTEYDRWIGQHYSTRTYTICPKCNSPQILICKQCNIKLKVPYGLARLYCPRCGTFFQIGRKS